MRAYPGHWVELRLGPLVSEGRTPLVSEGRTPLARAELCVCLLLLLLLLFVVILLLVRALALVALAHVVQARSIPLELPRALFYITFALEELEFLLFELELREVVKALLAARRGRARGHCVRISIGVGVSAAARRVVAMVSAATCVAWARRNGELAR